MKTKEELTALKEEFETLNKKLAELSAEELDMVTGGTADTGDGYGIHVIINHDDCVPILPVSNEMREYEWGTGPEGYDCSGLIT